MYKKKKLYLPLRMTYNDCRPYQMQFHVHNEYEILYFHQGKGTYIIGNHIHILQPGDLILMNGKTLHTSKTGPEEYCRTVIHFDPSYLRVKLNQSIFASTFDPFDKSGDHIIHLKSEARAEVEMLLKKMDHLSRQQDDNSYNRLLLSLLDLLYFLKPLCRASDQEMRRLAEKEFHVQRLLSYLEQNYTEDLNMDHIESELYLNKTYLCRIFKEVTGTTIFSYLNKFRLNKAKVLLIMDEQTTVSEVCFEIGYKHISHFSRLFKQEFGYTPNQFRGLVNNVSQRMADPDLIIATVQ
ncbi:AraC family transcriptional regulator [Paenibacillus sp. GYB004]|uniref:helix-turn-helix domain-containing protein n=1 Tax=Paenibacillus sp. GYB004 TaxID=2994393 RepID=UPI002F96B6B3